jgi:cellulose synthase/poly-beta-1,6-N-acetylglucosamine synthase-like glycosyltransferase
MEAWMLWLVLTFLFTLLALHPFITYPISLLIVAKLRPKPRAVSPLEPPLQIAILLCASNEELVIGEKVQNCLALQVAGPPPAIYVYTDGCVDRTVEIASSFGDRVNLITGEKRLGKTFGMNQLAQMARSHGADILFFTDANVVLRDDALRATLREFASASVGCVSGHLKYINGAESATALVGSYYWSLDETVKRLETATGSCMGADGSVFAIRAELFRTVPDNIIDDFFTSMSVLCDGWRCVYSPHVVAYERSATRSAEEYSRKVRIACRAFNCHRLLWPRLRLLPARDFYKYLSHKLLRWLTGVWVVCAIMFATLDLITADLSRIDSALIGFVVLLSVLATALLPGTPWAYLREGLLAIAGTSVGVVESLRGERFQTWSQAMSTRSEPTGQSGAGN